MVTASNRSGTKKLVDQAAMVKSRDRLQAIEDKLVAAGCDELIVASDAGAFTWRTTALLRAERGEDHRPPATLPVGGRRWAAQSMA
jgi:hypothetical protein